MDKAERIGKQNIQERWGDFEAEFARRTEERAAAREAKRRQKAITNPAEKLTVDAPGDAVAVYRARSAAARYNYKPRPEGALKRTIRLVKGLRQAKATADALPYCSAENRRELYSAVFHDAWAPVCNAADNAADTLWGFLSSLGYDLLEIIVFIANLAIKLWYYAGSVLLFVWDKIWDFRLWLDIHKKAAFQIFATVVTTVALGLILITSMSAYEYSYYGRKLGVTRSKTDVYDVIELLGDKLSQSSGTNISLDVERDIVFNKVFGFGLSVDTRDDILNTLTYMKDIRVQAYAVSINGKQIAVLDSEETAKQVVERAKTYFSEPREGYEYTSVSLADDIEIYEVGVVLGDIWNPESAVRLIETGSVKPLAEGEEPSPLITIYATATTTTDLKTKYSTKYVRNASLYVGDVRLVTSGKEGVTRVVSLVQLVNGVEVSSIEQSRTVISNPVDAVYYQGVKPLPERVGTGTWLFPLKGKYSVTSKFGRRHTNIPGASTYHKGTDYYQPLGSKIYAADGGKVTYAGYRGNQGWTVIINHGGGYETYYCHCSKMYVRVGQTVAQGQNIALVGMSGRTSGPHLHFEVHFNGVAFDPQTLNFIR